MFAFNVSTKIGNNAEVFATTSDTNGNMNKFGQLREEMGIILPYCSDHVCHLTLKKLHEDITYEEGWIDNI